MDSKIFIRNLEVRCRIGTLPRERTRKQKVVIDLEFPAPVRRAAKTDDLRKALNYQAIADCVTEFVSASRFFLIETLADRLASLLLKKFSLRELSLTVSKPGALKNARTVGVTLRRNHP
ncbi:MAG: Dihydroneopterin aldolase [Candidatus Omnitrophica bacterium ADurb.Bin292]|nr:MAG: Dihydroneopterin aldolase [Candidatus Omnitrophica bacterium ADurb.Bin292]HOG24088.1 dihydroneopterin aldolase [Candidatus Omnitrophota bacterium]